MVLRPDHFLPDQSVLTIYDRAASGHVSTKTYMIGLDHTLRQLPGHDANTCERIPPFSFDYSRSRDFPPNPFLVILNAEIKFRRYLRELPTPTVLPDDVMELIRKTIRLVELIYWDPAARPGTLAWCLLIMCFILALGNRPQGSNWGYTLAIVGFGLITIFMTVSALLLAFKGLDQLVRAQKGRLSLGDFFSDSIFRNIVLSLAATLGLYVFASLIFVSLFLPSHYFFL